MFIRSSLTYKCDLLYDNKQSVNGAFTIADTGTKKGRSKLAHYLYAEIRRIHSGQVVRKLTFIRSINTVLVLTQLRISRCLIYFNHEVIAIEGSSVWLANANSVLSYYTDKIKELNKYPCAVGA